MKMLFAAVHESGYGTWRRIHPSRRGLLIEVKRTEMLRRGNALLTLNRHWASLREKRLG